MLYYHGGVPGLRVGDLILPPSVTGVTTFSQVIAERAPWMMEFDTRFIADSGRLAPTPGPRDRVYVAARPYAPILFAAARTLAPWLEGPGTVYMVRPVGQLEPDTRVQVLDDRLLEPTWNCERAVVRAVMFPVSRADALASFPRSREYECLLHRIHSGRRVEPTPAQETLLRFIRARRARAARGGADAEGAAPGPVASVNARLRGTARDTGPRGLR